MLIIRLLVQVVFVPWKAGITINSIGFVDK